MARIGIFAAEIRPRRVNKCRKCGSLRVRRSRKTNVIEKALSRLFSVRPYRCDDCDCRFWAGYRDAR